VFKAIDREAAVIKFEHLQLLNHSIGNHCLRVLNADHDVGPFFSGGFFE
jgi:hypothetical protein